GRSLTATRPALPAPCVRGTEVPHRVASGLACWVTGSQRCCLALPAPSYTPPLDLGKHPGHQDAFQSRRCLRRSVRPAKMPRWGPGALIVPSSARRWLRCCGSSGCWELRSLPLSSTDYAPSIESGLPSAEPASV